MTQPDSFSQEETLLFTPLPCDALRVRGKDRVSVLHRLLTQDIRALAPNRGTESALLNARGKVLALMKVEAFGDSLRISVEQDFGKKTREALEKLIITEDVQIESEENLVRIILTGRRARAILETAFSLSLAPLRSERFFDLAEFSWGGNAAVLAEIRPDFFEVLLPASSAPSFEERLVQSEQAAQLSCRDLGGWEVYRIEHGLAKLGIDITEEDTLPETGLDGILASGTKGCYPGQEVVARTNTYSGHAKKLRVLMFTSQRVPNPGSPIFSGGGEIGRITSSCFSARQQKTMSFAYLRRGHFEIGSKTFLTINGLESETAVLDPRDLRNQSGRQG